ncbi:MAG: hypothetical protein AAFV19_06230 [Pseudomonadota bacterium]
MVAESVFGHVLATLLNAPVSSAWQEQMQGCWYMRRIRGTDDPEFAT